MLRAGSACQERIGYRRLWLALPGQTSAPVQGRIAQPARNHGVADDDIQHAVRRALRRCDMGENLTMHIGPASDGALLEVGVLDLDGPPWIQRPPSTPEARSACPDVIIPTALSCDRAAAIRLGRAHRRRAEHAAPLPAQGVASFGAPNGASAVYKAWDLVAL